MKIIGFGRSAEPSLTLHLTWLKIPKLFHNYLTKIYYNDNNKNSISIIT